LEWSRLHLGHLEKSRVTLRDKKQQAEPKAGQQCNRPRRSLTAAPKVERDIGGECLNEPWSAA
jgi:hypothetical protein